ncbi:MAG TPA: MOSC domain-containing protein [Nitrososphaerales archaeon]|nr:MOSC domain-containing protein [Nitrososphaerales archaeon]
MVSVNVSTPREIGTSRGKPVLSAILKEPMEGPVSVRWGNMEGDRQADPAVHGGERKAVYAYPSEHYEYWRKRFPEMDIPWGSLGENLTTEGLLEDVVHSGDVFAIGSAQLAATQPRLPCFKLGIRFGTASIIRTFLESERTGFYLQVLREGQIQAGDEIRQVSASPGSETITQMVRAVKKRA